MIPTTLADVARATRGEVPARGAGLVVSRVVTDSRSVLPGDLFVAIRGERHDGHDHAVEAAARGAVAVVASRAVDVPVTVLVEDTVAALGGLARDLLDRLRADGRPDVVAITGSVGKTSTKDLLAQVLAETGPTVAAHGSYNNDIGLPSTMLRCDAATHYLVLEMGSRGVGHIARLADLARPRVGVVLGVGSAHLGEFGDKETTARAKAELVEALPPASAGGVAVLNADDSLVRDMARRTAARVVTYGTSASVDVRACDVALDERARPSFRLEADGETHPVSMQLTGEPAVMHALASVAAARALGVPVAEAVAALRRAGPGSPGRMSVHTTASGVTVVDDSYNASPESVAAALRSLVAMTSTTGRTWAVLGEMRELGASSAHEHRRVGRLVARLGVGRLLVVGDAGRPILEGAQEAGYVAGTAVPDVPTALTELRRDAAPGDVVLAKASRAVGLDAVVAGLLGDGRDGAVVGQATR